MFRILLAFMIAFSTAVYPMVASANSNFIFRYKSGNVSSANYIPPNTADYDITARFTGFVGEPMEEFVPIKPGSSVARWRMGEGSMPSGLSFIDADGRLAGTPSRVDNTHFVAHGIDPNGFESTTAGVTVQILTPRDYANKVDLYAHSDRHFSLPITKGGKVIDHWVYDIALPSWASASSGWLQGTPPAGSEGVYGLALSGRNHVGEEIAFVYGTLTVEAGPTISFIPDTAKHPSDDFAVRARVQRTFGELAFSLEGDLPSNLRFNKADGEIYGRISTFSTSSTLRIAARDIDGTVGYSNWFTLSSFDPVVDITNINDLSLVLGEPVHYRFSAADLSGTKNWLVSAGTLPAGITLDEETGVLSGTPEQIERQENVVLSVSTSDGGADTSNPFAIEVFPAPIIAETTPIRTRINTPFTSLPPVVSGANSPTYALADGFSLPTGLNFNATTGQTDGQVSAPGNHSVSFVVNDADGRASSPFIQGVEAFNPLSIDYDASYALPRMSEITPILPTIPEDSIMPSGNNTFGSFSISPSLPEGLSFGNRSGAIMGTPVNEGLYGPFSVTLVDGSGEVATSDPFTLEVTPRLDLTVSVDKTTVKAWIPVSEYLVSAQSFVGEVTWSLEEGAIPDGLMFRNDGRVTGKATTVGTSPGIILRATDSEGSTAATEPFTLSVVPPDPIEFNETFEWSVSRAFAKQLSALNSAGETTFTVAPGTPLPGGVSLSSDGILSGTINTVSSTSHTVTVEDSQGRTDTGTLAIIIRPQMTMTLASEHTIARASEASIIPIIENGIGDVSFTRSGTLPGGLSLNGSTGEIAGIPSATGVWNGIRITASDDAGNIVEQTIRITVADRNDLSLSYDFSNPLTVNSSSGLPVLPDTPTNAIGETSFTYTGTLPQGLSLNATTGAFTGTPTETGSFPGISVTIEDGEGQTDTFGPFSISVTTAGPLNVSDQDRWVRKGSFMNTGPISATNAIEPLTYTATNGLPAGLTVIASDGSLQGADAPLGDHVVRMQVEDGIGRTDTFNLVVHVVDDLSVSYQDATFNLHSEGVLSPVVDSVIGTPAFTLSGALPSGLSLEPTSGQITGTPTQTGTFSGLTATIVDEGVTGNSATSAPFSITVNPRLPLEVSYPSNNAVIASQPYSLSPAVENAVGSLNWSYSGTLPMGITFDPATGKFEGVANEVGNFPNVSVTATDTLDGSTSTAVLSFSVASDGLPIRLDTYDVATKAGYAFEAKLPKVSNAVGDYYFISPDAASHGLSFDPSTGVISGTINETTRITINVEVTDSTNRLTSEPVVIDVIPNIRLTVRDHIDVTVSAEMTPVFPLTDYAIGSVEYELFGVLPQGLSFDTNTGRIWGTPTEMGTFSGLSIRAVDSIEDTTISDDFAITVHPSGVVPYVPYVTSSFYLTAGTTLMNFTPIWNPKKTGDVVTLNKPLPDGITLDPTTGTMYGTPNHGAKGVYSGYVLTITDTAGLSAYSNEFTINVIPSERGTFYGNTVTVRTGQPFESAPPSYDGTTVVGTLSYSKAGSNWNSWYVDADVDPESGIVFGSVRAGSTIQLPVTPTDDVGNHSNYSVAVNVVPFGITYASTDDVELGDEVSVLPDLTNAVGMTSFSIGDGTLPSGLTLDENTGLISGILTNTGWSSWFNVNVTDDYGTAQSSNVRFNVVDTTPDAFAWPDVADAEPNTNVFSDAITITGLTNNAPYTLTADSTAYLYRCNTSGGSCITVSSISASTSSYTYKLMLRSGDYGETVSATLDVNGVSTTWNVTTRDLNNTPDDFHFVALSDQPRDTNVESNVIQITGIQDPALVSVTSNSPGVTSIRRGASSPLTGNYSDIETSSITVVDGQYIQLLTRSSLDYEGTVEVHVTVGTKTSVWTVGSEAFSDTPVGFAIPETFNATPNTYTESELVPVTGISDFVPVTFSGDASNMVGKICQTPTGGNCSNWISGSFNANPGSYLMFRLRSHPDPEGVKTMTVNVGGATAEWKVNTRPLDLDPNAFSFTDLTGVNTNAFVDSEYIQMSGIPDYIPISISGDTTAQFRHCNGQGSYCSSWYGVGDSGASIRDGRYLQLRFTTDDLYSMTRSATITVGNFSTTWTITTMDEP